MKTSSPTSPKPIEPKSILIIGPPGCGKTTLMLTFPKLRVLDCDGNLDGPERFLRRGIVNGVQKLGGFMPNLDYSYESIKFIDGDPSHPRPIEDCYRHLLKVATELKDDKDCETIGCDNLTVVNEFIVRAVLNEQGLKEGTKDFIMQPHFWGAFKSKLLALINRLRSSGKTTLYCIHEVKKTEPDPIKMLQERIIAYEPAIQSGIADYFAGFFTDMWRCECEKQVVGYKYTARTMRTKLSDLKNSMGLPEVIENPTYEKIKPYLT